MKLFNNKLAISLFAISTMATAFVGCKDEEAEKWVDLRYRVEDSYLISASNPEPIVFQVKSTDKWEVFGKYDWYTITPNTGDPGETYDVTIQCEENTNLDDRIDTINIKSDYWTGKTFKLTQKGIAYLTTDIPAIIDQNGGSSAFNISSNQKWTAKVTEGDIWLSIEQGVEGELNGTVKIIATPNKGELRTGKVTIYDRHNKVASVVDCTQNGIQLDPQIPDNGEWFQLYEEAQTLTIHVESNAEWTVSKENEADETWYNIPVTSFNGSADIQVKLDEHTGTKVRTGVLVLSTKEVEGATPVIKKVRFKQANPQIPAVTELNRTLAANEAYYGPGSMMPGRYNFYLNALNGADINLFFIWNGSNPYAELRYHIVGNKTSLSTTPWCSDVFNENANCIKDVDPAKANVLSWDIQKYVDEKDPTKVWIYSEWILNGDVIAKCISDGFKDGTQSTDTWKVPFDQISAGGNFMLKALKKNVTITKYEYIAPLEWGD